MRFGGHETFAIRDGWLYKGLNLLVNNPRKFHSEEAADRLGVGGNMAKSIGHWLLATEIAEKNSEKIGTKNRSVLEPTQLASTIMDHDPYFMDPGTWWALHINLANNKDHALSWYWFFNYFAQTRFEKGVCLESIKKYLRMTLSRLPGNKTLERDLSVLLASYAREIPEPQIDPEESNDCPFIELDLLHYYRESGFYHLNTSSKPVPSHLIGYALSRMKKEETHQSVEISMKDAAFQPGSPGRVFAVSSETLFEWINTAEADLGKDALALEGLASNRFIRFDNRTPVQWLIRHYTNNTKLGLTEWVELKDN
jgi:hypothetical protein